MLERFFSFSHFELIRKLDDVLGFELLCWWFAWVNFGGFGAMRLVEARWIQRKIEHSGSNPFQNKLTQSAEPSTHESHDNLMLFYKCTFCCIQRAVCDARVWACVVVHVCVCVSVPYAQHSVVWWEWWWWWWEMKFAFVLFAFALLKKIKKIFECRCVPWSLYARCRRRSLTGSNKNAYCLCECIFHFVQTT